MKLLYCRSCGDVFSLRYERRTCFCGRSSGQYGADGLNAWYDGPAVPIGFDNASFHNARELQPESGRGKKFTAFVIPKDCPTMRGATCRE